MCGVRLAHPEARYFLEAVLHFPMARYCENCTVRSLCQHRFSLPSLLQPAHWRQTRTIPVAAAPFAQHSFWFETLHCSHSTWTAEKAECSLTTSHLPKAIVSAFVFNCSILNSWLLLHFFDYETGLCSMCFVIDGAVPISNPFSKQQLENTFQVPLTKNSWCIFKDFGLGWEKGREYQKGWASLTALLPKHTVISMIDGVLGQTLEGFWTHCSGVVWVSEGHSGRCD